MVAIEYSTDDEDNNGPYGDQYEQPGAGTQAAASALLDFGAASGEKQLTPEQLFKQSQEKKHRYFNALAGNITGMDEEDEDYMYDFNVPWNAGEQQARLEQIKSPMRNTTSETSRRVTISHQKKPVHNPYLRTFTTNQRKTRPGSLAVRDKENSIATVVKKKPPPQQQYLPQNGLAMSSKPVATKKTALSSTAPKTTTALDYALKIKANMNEGGIFTAAQHGLVATANKNTKPYTRRTNKLEEQFFKIICDTTKDKDEFIYSICTKMIFNDSTLEDDREFYSLLSGEKTGSKKLILNRCCNIYTLNIMNTRTKLPLDFKTQNQYLKQVFGIFHMKGIQYRQGDFYGDGGLLGVVKQDYENKLEEDPTLGTGRTKAEFDEEGELKYQEALRKGDLKPFEDNTDLLRCIVMGLGMKCGFRGRKEIALATWDYFDISIIQKGPRKGRTIISARPGGGWDKTHRLGIKNGNTRSQKPSIEENPLDPNCFVKLVLHYRSQCDMEKQKRFLCYPNNSRIRKVRFKPNTQVGEKAVVKMVKYVAKLCRFTDFEKYVTHDNRHQCGTAIYSNPNIPDKEKLAHMRHTAMPIAGVYTHTNKATRAAVQNALHLSIHTKEELFPEAAAVGKQAAPTIESKEQKPASKPSPVLPIGSILQDIRPVLADESKPAASDETVVEAKGIKRNQVSDVDHTNLQQECKRLKQENKILLNENKTLLDEKKTLTEENTSLVIENQQEELRLAYDINMKSFELKAAQESLNEKKEENKTLKDENISLKQDLQHTKEEKKNLERMQEQRESEERMLLRFQQQQQQQPKCAIM